LGLARLGSTKETGKQITAGSAQKPTMRPNILRNLANLQSTQ
jgi:hypothetical protein